MIMNKMKIASLLLLIAVFIVLPAAGNADNSDSFLQRHNRDHDMKVKAPTALPPVFESRFTPPEKALAGNEFTLSESVSPARFGQDYSDVARLTDGRMVACWQDGRNGSYMIYAQILGIGGNPSGSNFLVADNYQGSNLIEPKAVSDGSGGFYIVWRDYSTGRITAKRFDASLNLVAGPFDVNDISDGSYAGFFDITAFPGGNLIAVWENYTGENDISLRIFTPSGVPLFDAVKINTDTDLTLNWEPSVAFDTVISAIAVAWEGAVGTDDRTVYMQYVNLDGSLYGTNFTPVGAGALDNYQMSPKIAFDALDKFIVTWIDTRDAGNRIYLQRAGRTSGLIGTNTPVSADNSDFIYNHDLVAEESSFTEAWSIYDLTSIYAILMQRFDNGTVPDGGITTGYSTADGFVDNVSEGYDKGGNLHVLWTDNETSQTDIYFQRFSPDGTPLHAEVTALNDDTRGANSTHADIAIIDDSRTVAVFTDQRYDAGDIFLQMFNSDGTLVGSNIILDDDPLAYRQDYPSVAVASDGSFLVASWLGYTAPGGVFGQRGYLEIDPMTDPFVTTTEFLIDDLSNIGAPRIAVSESNKIFAVYGFSYPLFNFLYGKILNSDGSQVGERLNIDNRDFIQYDVDCDGNNIFTVSYLLLTANGPSAAFVRYNDAGAELGSFATAGSGISGVNMREFSTAVGSTGIIYLLWRGDDDNLYLTSLDINGAVLEPSFQVNDDPSAGPEQIRLAVGTNGSLIASWIDHREGQPRMYYQVYQANLATVAGNLPASTTPSYFMQDPAVAGNNSKIWLAWSDPREYGLNVIARQADYVPTDVNDDDPANLPTQYALEQNYPNPFNPTTEIAFSLPTRSDIELNVYDILGRKVRTLAEGTLDAGKHSVTWDATDDRGKKVASGVYFYLLKSGNVHESRKMILLK